MQIPKQAVLLRIFIGEDDKFGGAPLYEAIVLKARELHLAGATVLRGPMGFGASSRLHTTKILRLSEDLPLVIEIVDSEDVEEAQRLIALLPRDQFSVRRKVHRADPARWLVAVPDSDAALSRLLRETGVVAIGDGAGGYAHNAAIHVITSSGRLMALFDLERYEEALAFARALAN